MSPILWLAAVMLFAATSAAEAQTTSPTGDSAVTETGGQQVVTAFAIRSGKIALSSANGGPAYLPDGTYTNESGTIIVILDGRIVRLQGESGEIIEISSVRINRQRGIVLTPGTSALMAVSDITLPWGTFRNEEGTASLKVAAGRPTAFKLP